MCHPDGAGLHEKKLNDVRHAQTHGVTEISGMTSWRGAIVWQSVRKAGGRGTPTLQVGAQKAADFAGSMGWPYATS